MTATHYLTFQTHSDGFEWMLQSICDKILHYTITDIVDTSDPDYTHFNYRDEAAQREIDRIDMDPETFELMWAERRPFTLVEQIQRFQQDWAQAWIDTLILSEPLTEAEIEFLNTLDTERMSWFDTGEVRTLHR